MKRHLPDLTLVVAISVILAATLSGARGETLGRFQFCLVCGDQGTADAALNMLLFIPFGTALAWKGRGAAPAVIAGACLALGIELTQLALPGRYSTLGDVVFDAIGAGLGALLFARVQDGILRRGHGWRRLFITTASVAFVWVATPLFFRPALQHGSYFGQWMADLGDGLSHYDGRVFAASIAGMPLPPHRLSDPVAVRAALTTGRSLTVAAQAGTPPRRLAPVFSIFTGRQQEVLILGAQGSDLIWQARSLAATSRLQWVEARWKGALKEVTVGDSLRLEARIRRPASICMSLNARHWCGGLPPARGWSLFLSDASVPAPLQGLLDTGWIAVLVLLALWWAPGPESSAIAAGLLLACLLFVSAWTGLAVGIPATVGWAVGLTSALGARHRQTRNADPSHS